MIPGALFYKIFYIYRMNGFFKYFLFLILLLPGALAAQGPTEEYNHSEVSEKDLGYERWKQLTKDVHYDVDELKPKKKKAKEPDFDRDAEVDPPASWDFGAWSAPAKVILILFFGMIIALIIYQVVKNQNKKIGKTPVPSDEEIIEKIEEDIQRSDIDSYLGRAIAEGNYSLAIRLHYLNILKALSLAGIIKWKKDKTNRTYLYEMKEKEMKSDFRELTNIFERVWYGNVILEQWEFESVAPVFEIFSDKIKNGAS